MDNSICHGCDMVVMFIAPTIGLSSSILNSSNASPTTMEINYLPETGSISNGVCTYSVQQVASCVYQGTSASGHTNVIQYFNEYYNKTYHLLFYILDSKVNAQNGANINSNNALSAKSTIYNSISCPSYLSPLNYRGHEYYVPVSYGHLQYESPSGMTQRCQSAQVTVSASVSAGTGVAGKIGISYTYDLYDFCMQENHGYINNDQWQFESHVGGKTYARFVTATTVSFNPGYRQSIDFSSIGNTTYEKASSGWFGTTYTLEPSSLQLVNCYKSPILN
ncbi:MAG: hypothetical protein ACYCSO_03040 [Cuniculiplasma sp.]